MITCTLLQNPLLLAVVPMPGRPFIHKAILIRH
jgi:hypothetical protein